MIHDVSVKTYNAPCKIPLLLLLLDLPLLLFLSKISEMILLQTLQLQLQRVYVSAHFGG